MSDQFFFINKGDGSTSKPIAMPPDAKTNTASDEFFFIPKSQQAQSKDELKEIAPYAGAALGAAYKLKQMAKDEKTPMPYDQNSNMTPKGLQSYVNSQIDPNYKISIKQLEKISGLPVRTMAEAQAAIRLVQGKEAKRIAVPHTDTSGTTRYTYRTESGRQPYDLSPYRNTIMNRIKTTVPSVAPVGKVAGQGAIAGAAMAPMAVNIAEEKILGLPTEKEKWMSLIGSGLMMSRNPYAVAAGVGLQAPYGIKHGNELMQEMGLGEINPTAFGGAPEALQSPLSLPSKSVSGLP